MPTDPTAPSPIASRALGSQGPEWLANRHPIYDAWRQIWRRNERRARGGQFVLDELDRFEWEPANSEHYKSRQAQAVYLNFPDAFATAQTGHLQREAPEPDAGLDFGTLGAVERTENQALPSRAELVYYNATGVGNDGAAWDPFWLGAARRAHHTGHRWVYVEAPPTRPASFADELRGSRPYLVEFSPLSVTDWHIERGVLQYAIIRPPSRRPKLVGGGLQGTTATRGFLLLVRAGWDGFGPDYEAGGWWLYDPDRHLTATGDWASTGGDIPLVPLYYERDDGLDGDEENNSEPAMSRPGTSEIGAAAIAYMNLAAAADFDAKDAASSVTLVNGADPDQAKVVAQQKADGSRIIFIPPAAGASFAGGGQLPTITDASMGAVVADVFDRRLDQKRREVDEIAAREATSTPDASGTSKRVGFGETKAPRLALLAANLEEAQNTAIHFLEQRWGNPAPTGSVSWPRDFDLTDVLDTIAKHLDLQTVAGVMSPTLTADALTRAAEEAGLVADDEVRATVHDEYLDAAKNAETTRRQSANANAELAAILRGQGGGNNGNGEGAPPPEAPAPAAAQA